MTAALTAPARQPEPPLRLTLTFINNHRCSQYQHVEGWLECGHGMLIRPADVAAREAEARAEAAALGGERG